MNNWKDEFDKARKKGLFAVYGPLGMGIKYDRLEDFIEMLLTDFAKQVEEEVIKELHLRQASTAKDVIDQDYENSYVQNFNDGMERAEDIFKEKLAHLLKVVRGEG